MKSPLLMGLAAATFIAAPNGIVAGQDASRLEAPARARVIGGTIAVLDSFYVFPEVARRIADSLLARNDRGAYDGYADATAFSNQLNDDVRELSHDKHLRVSYSAGQFVARPLTATAAPSPEMVQFLRNQMDLVNCGFVKAEQLEGNVGYLKVDGFHDVDACRATASAAMNFIAGARALIIDLRDNDGGKAQMVSYVSSYLFATRTHLTDVWERKTGRTDELWTSDDVPGRRFGGEKPVYVLTSAKTFSAAEEFSYNLKSLKRATIVGEATGGGAHPVTTVTVEGHFMVAVPFARAINPITKTNWEGVGVEPDVKVPASEALAAALSLVRAGPRR